MARHEELATISRELRELTRELDMSTVILAQVNREGVKRGVATKEDTGGTYQIAQDADIYYIIREKSKDEIEADGPAKGGLYGFLDKHRNGKQKLGCSIAADLDTMRLWEA